MDRLVLVNQPVVLAALVVCSGGSAWAAPDAHDPARLAGVWSGSRTTTAKGSKQALWLEGKNAPCPQQNCLFQTKYELGRDE